MKLLFLDRKVIRVITLAIIIALCAFFFRNECTQGINGTFPYFSGAANFTKLFDWRISPTEYDKVAALPYDEYRAYRSVGTPQTMKNSVNAYGYVLVALTARHLFPGLGDIQSVILLQVLTHILLSLFVICFLLKAPPQRGLFLILYAINPLVLHIVTFPFYYFWTVIPSAALAVIWYREAKNPILVPIISILMLFALLIRPTLLLISLFVFAIAFYKNKNSKTQHIITTSLLCFIISLPMIYHHGALRTIYHTIYTGIGAYPNPYGIKEISETSGHELYHKVTGQEISSHAIHGDYGSQRVMQQYTHILKQRYLHILHQSPSLLIKNAILNTVQAFGVGYDADRPWSRPITILIGTILLSILIIARQWIWIMGILSYTLAFTLYYPPVPSYLFGAYLLSALGLSEALEKIFEFSKLQRLFVNQELMGT